MGATPTSQVASVQPLGDGATVSLSCGHRYYMAASTLPMVWPRPALLAVRTRVRGVTVEGGIVRCRSCDAPIVWGLTKSGKRCPFDVVDGRRTETSHFASCPQANTWSRRNSKPKADQ